MQKPKVSIIIVNWNGKDDTISCLSSLKKLKAETLSVQIIVVDNGSTDGSQKKIREKFPDCILLEQKENKGFTGGNNIGMKYAKKEGSDFFWILNNDTTVDTNALIPLIDSFKYSNVGVSGSKIYFMKGREFHYSRYDEKDRGNVLWYAGGIIDWANMYGSHRGVDEIDRGQYDISEKTDYVTGCSFMISNETLEKVGFFNTTYFAYLEDMDYSMRVKSHGLQIVYVPDSKVWHKNAGSTSKPGSNVQEYYMTRNRIIFGMKYAPLHTKVALFRESLSFLIHGNSIKKKAIIDAYIHRTGKQI